MSYVPLDNGLRIQVLPSITHLPECQKHHFAAFIQDPSILVVWDDDPSHLLFRAQSIEDQLMNWAWNVDNEENEKSSTAVPSKIASRAVSHAPSTRVKEVSSSQVSDSEQTLAEPPRRVVLIQPILTAATLILILAAMGAGWKQIALELMVDKAWIRLAFVAVVPLQIWLALVSLIPLSRGGAKLTLTVLLSINRRLRRTGYRSNQSNDQQYQILFWDRSSTPHSWYSSSRHYPVSGVQGRSLVGH